MSYAPDSVYLMHYSRVTGIPRLAATLKAQIRELVRIVNECAAAPEPPQAIRAAMLEMWLRLLQQQGSTRSRSEIEELLKGDLDLNTQGLLIWFERQRRSHQA